jgi:hypothetical protein
MKNGLLVGVRTQDLGTLARSLPSDQVELHVAIGLTEVKRLCAEGSIDYVFLGRELDLEFKMKTLEYIISVSPTTQIHVLGRDGDPVAFVNSILD